MPNPALIGYRATGKTTVGRLLADRLGCQCIDTDAEIVRRAGCSIAQIFASQGETAFRDLESQIIDDITQRRHVVLSLGGGAILRPENRQKIIGRCRPIVWLQANVETIYERINQDAGSTSQRPNLTNQGGIEEVRQVLQQRMRLYEECSTLSLDTETRSPEQLVIVIEESISAGNE